MVTVRQKLWWVESSAELWGRTVTTSPFGFVLWYKVGLNLRYIRLYFNPRRLIGRLTYDASPLCSHFDCASSVRCGADDAALPPWSPAWQEKTLVPGEEEEATKSAGQVTHWLPERWWGLNLSIHIQWDQIIIFSLILESLTQIKVTSLNKWQKCMCLVIWTIMQCVCVCAMQ